MKRLLAVAAILLTAAAPPQQPRARDLGVPFEGTRGPLNAITDVAGVEVGHTTLISGSGKLVVGKGPVRTGVTAVLPRGRSSTTPVFGAWFTLNSAGEMTGTTWLEERGLIDGPIMITNTHSVGVVRDAAVRWMVANGWVADWHAPVAAETYDGVLNDINGFHVETRHALAAIDTARGGAVLEGAVGGGTGMICNGFKGGIGTASRKLPAELGGYTVGVLVQCNYGNRRILRIAGAPVGAELMTTNPICYASRAAASEKRPWNFPDCARENAGGDDAGQPDGSIIIVVATAQAACKAPIARPWAARLGGERRIRRHLHRLLDRKSRAEERRFGNRAEHRADAPQRLADAAVRGRDPGHRGGGRQRDGGGNDDGRRRWRARPEASARRAACGPGEI